LLCKQGVDERRLLFVSCFPKSGSTYLMKLLCEITGFPRLEPLAFKGSNEQELDEGKLIRYRFSDGVVHQHLQAKHFNLQLAKEHNIQFAVLLRRIPDVIPSLVDHFCKESVHFPTGNVPPWFFELEPSEQYDFVIEFHMPWLFNFLMSWEQAEGSAPIEWVTYEELFADQVGTVTRLLKFWGLEANPSRIQTAIEAVRHMPTRLNQGIVGRGKTLSEKQLQTLHEMADKCRFAAMTRQRVGLSG